MVIDVDPRNGGAETWARLVEEYGPKLEKTTTSLTPSGGQHFIYRDPVGLRCSTGLLGRGIDVKAEGGMVVLPPSINLDGQYRWKDGYGPFETPPATLPNELLALLERGDEEDCQPPSAPCDGNLDHLENLDNVPSGQGATTAYGRKVLTDEANRIRSAREGERNDTLNLAVFKVGQLVQEGQINEREAVEVLFAAAREVGLGTEEIRRTIESGLTAGKANPRTKGASICREATIGQLASQVKPEAVDWLWKDRIPLAKLTVIDGDPGLGKSMLTLDLAARVSTGKGSPDEKPLAEGGVVILSAEDGAADTIAPRLIASGADPSRIESWMSASRFKSPTTFRKLRRPSTK